MIDICSLADDVHKSNVLAGWWDNYPKKSDRHDTAMMLVVSEVAEAMEGSRKGLMDDHLPQYFMFDVELADTAIRLLDLVGAYEIKLYVDFMARVDRSVILMNHMSLTVPEQLLRIVRGACGRVGFDSSQSDEVQQALISTLAVAQINNVDIWRLISKKRQYNLDRADHKREVRAKAGGKMY